MKAVFWESAKIVKTIKELQRCTSSMETTRLHFHSSRNRVTCPDESVVFFCFQYVSRSTLVYRALYYGKIETLTSQLTKTCIVNKNQMRH